MWASWSVPKVCLYSFTTRTRLFISLLPIIIVVSLSLNFLMVTLLLGEMVQKIPSYNMRLNKPARILRNCFLFVTWLAWFTVEQRIFSSRSCYFSFFIKVLFLIRRNIDAVKHIVTPFNSPNHFYKTLLLLPRDYFEHANPLIFILNLLDLCNNVDFELILFKICDLLRVVRKHGHDLIKFFSFSELYFLLSHLFFCQIFY